MDDLEVLLASSQQHSQGDARTFCEAMIDSDQFFGVRPTLTCFAFTSDNDAYPLSTTLQLPLRDYVKNDHLAMQRIYSFLPLQDRNIYEKAITTIAGRTLETGVGLHTFVSFKRQRSQPITTIYFSLEAYRVLPPR